LDAQKEIIDTLKELMTREAKLEKSQMDGPMDLKSANLDSLTKIRLIMAIEESFDIEISEMEASQMTSLEEIASIVAAKDPKIKFP